MNELTPVGIAYGCRVGASRSLVGVRFGVSVPHCSDMTNISHRNVSEQHRWLWEREREKILLHWSLLLCQDKIYLKEKLDGNRIKTGLNLDERPKHRPGQELDQSN